MNKYHNGKIYKIVDVGYNKCYIGSTTEKLSIRFCTHTHHYRTYDENNKKRYCRCFELFSEYGVNTCKMELVETCKCETKEELLRCAGEHIRNNDCLNKVIAGRTDKEYRHDNKRKLKEIKHDDCLKSAGRYRVKSKEWRVKNKEQQQYRARTFTCVCGSTCNNTHRIRHEETQKKKHQNYLKSLEQD